MSVHEVSGRPLPNQPTDSSSSRQTAYPKARAGAPGFRGRSEDDLRIRLAEKEILLREVHHRVKNDVAALGAYLSLQADRLPANSLERRALLEARTRVESMSRLYEHLALAQNYETLPAGEYLMELVEELRSLVPDSDRVEIRAELEEINLESRKLFPLGMAVNELVVNSIKHAFPNDRTGVVRVILRREQDGTVLVGIEDDGVGMPKGSEPQDGLGRVLVPALVAQIGGLIEESVPPGGGWTVRIRIPQSQGLRA